MAHVAAAIVGAWMAATVALAEAPERPAHQGTIRSWFERVSRDYAETIRKLSVETAPNPVLDAAARLEAERRQRIAEAAVPKIAAGGATVDVQQPGADPPAPSGYVDRFIAWLRRAGEAYETEIVRKLERQPAATATAKSEPEPEQKLSTPVPPFVTPPQAAIVIESPRLTEAEQAAASKAMADARASELRRQADKAAEEARKKMESKRTAELLPPSDLKRMSDSAKATDDPRKSADIKRVAEPKVADDARRSTDVAKMAEEARKAADDIKRALDTAREKIATGAKSARREKPKLAAVAPTPVRATASKLRRTARTSTRCARAGMVVTPPGRYVVKPGDSYWRIAEAHYGDGNRYPVIRKANKRRGTLIHPCQRLYIPRL